MAGTIRCLSVKQVNEYIKMLMDGDTVLGNVWIRAEISNYKSNYSSGHLYFSLKEDESRISAVMFRSYASRLAFSPENGMKVLAHGRITTFVRDGQYQIYVDEMLPDGVGSLAVAFEQLRRKLEGMGLFDEARKKPLPRYPERIGIITSPTGAAIHDMMNILGRRFPLASILLYPSLVQGPEAPADLIGGLRYFNREKNADVILIGRGGGSMEDLWAFNNEELAFEIAASDIPVISAVGHESDFTICDFVADKRAPTPSAAAELAVPDREELFLRLKNAESKLLRGVSGQIDWYRKQLKTYREIGALSPKRSFAAEKRMTVAHLEEQMAAALEKKQTAGRAELNALAAKLGALSPLGVLARGYGVAEHEEGGVIRSVKNVKKEDRIVIRVSDGKILSRVEETRKKKKNG